MSVDDHRSTQTPSRIRKIVMPLNATGFPVAGTP